MTPIARLLVGTAALLLLLAPSASAADDPLVRAAAASDMTAVRALLRQGHDVDSRAADGSTALHWAVRAEDLDTINALLRAGAHATVANALGVTPIYVAAEQGHAAILRRLLDAGADVKTTDASGDTLLMAAVRAGNADAVDVLLERGAPVNAGEHTALMWAARRNDTAIMKRLLARGAEVDTRTRAGEKPAARPPGAGGGSHGVGIVRSGVPPQGEQQPIPGGMTPLLFAARDGQVDARGAARRGGRRRQRRRPERHHAARHGAHERAVRRRASCSSIATPMRGAPTGGGGRRSGPLSMPAISPVRSGAPADENGVDRAGRARCHRDAPRRRRRRQRAREGIPAGAAVLLTLGSLEWVDFTGQTPFIRAAQAGDVPVMQLLLSKGADPKIATFNGTTALMAAAGVNWVIGETFIESPAEWLEAVQLCLDRAIDVNAVNAMGLQAVHGAANRGSDDIIELLARHGAELDRPG